VNGVRRRLSVSRQRGAFIPFAERLSPLQFQDSCLLARRMLCEGSMTMLLGEVQKRLASAFPNALIEVVDLTGTQDHYQARITSSAFEGKSIIQQHQLVYRALGDAMDGPIHALALETRAPVAITLPKGNI